MFTTLMLILVAGLMILLGFAHKEITGLWDEREILRGKLIDAERRCEKMDDLHDALRRMIRAYENEKGRRIRAEADLDMCMTRVE